MFYQSVVGSVLVFAVVCWESRIRASDTNRPDKAIWKRWPYALRLETMVERR